MLRLILGCRRNEWRRLRALGRRTAPAAERSLTSAASAVLLGLAWVVLFGVLWLLQGRLAP